MNCLLTMALLAIAADDEGVEFFEKQVRPLLVRRCIGCHSADTKKKGGLALDSRASWERGGDTGAALVAGDPDNSLLIAAVRRVDIKMPPDNPLPAAEVALLVRWVKMGAPAPAGATRPSAADPRDHWAFRAPVRPAVPQVKDAAWPRGDIDRFLLAEMESRGIRPAVDVDPAALLRRVRFDLTGLPPTPTEMDDFRRECASLGNTAALEQLTDRLLADPAMGERWGRHWMDVARYAEFGGGGGARAVFADAWRWRDWVIDAFNRDMPYDRFVVEQLAGDLLPHGSLAERDRQVIATGFLTLSPLITSAPRRDEQFLMDLADEQIDVTTKAFLGLTVACARCHDHKFDPVPTADYYALAGIFRSTELRQTMMCPKKRHIVAYYVGEPLMGRTRKEADAHVAALLTIQDKQDRIAEIETVLGNVKRPRKSAKEKAPAIDKDALSRELAALKTEIAKLRVSVPPMPPTATAVADAAKPADIAIHVRGEIGELGPKVARGVLSTIGSAPAIAAGRSGRLELARWIASRDNPLAARVMVNRIWLHLMATPLVGSPDNFGLTGERPTHPELLDHLATRFMDEGWSVKRMIRTIVLSRAYGLAAIRSPADPDNQWCSAGARRRLEAEAIRDAMLAFAGKLDPVPPGRPLVKPLRIEEVKQGAAPHIEHTDKRSVYCAWVRGGFLPEVLRVFDVADADTVVGRRDDTVVAPQALFLLNSPFAMDTARHAARRLLADPNLDDAGRIDLAVRRALGRPATPAETARLKGLIDGVLAANRTDVKGEMEPAVAAWAAMCQVLMASAEFRYLN